jgi:hypothetical protein
LGNGLGHTLKYLGGELQRRISNLAERNPTFGRQLIQKTDMGPHSTMKTLNLLASDESYHDDFPVIGLLLPSTNSVMSHSWRISNEEVSFAGHIQNCYVCFIDMMNSTKIASELNSTQISRYYSIFLNATATIAKNFRAKIIKNAGDCLIFYFPKTSTSSDNQSAFKDVYLNAE